MAHWSTIALVGWSAGVLAAQTVQGTVRGFTGEPAAGVVLNVLDERGDYVADTSTRKDGRYRLPSTGGAKVRAWLEGVVLTLPMAAGPIDFDFQSAPHFTLRGHAVDPAGKALAGLELFCMDREGWLATATTDAAGAFAVRSNQIVDHLLVDPHGWRHRVDGPFANDRGIAVDLRLEKQFFLLEGTLRDEHLQVVSDAQIVAAARRENVHAVRTDAEGGWRLWCNRTVTSLSWTAGQRASHSLQGEWATAATVAIDFRSCGFVVLTGRVLHADGRPVAGARVIALDTCEVQRHLPEHVATTSADGSFRALVHASAGCLVTWVGEQCVTVKGPWHEDASVELRDGR